MTLWLALLALTLVAMAFVAVPLWRGRDVAPDADTLGRRRDKNREVFLQRQQELDNELQLGVVTAGDHARMRTELERAFLRDMEALDSLKVRHAARRALALPVAMLVLIPLASLLIYRQWGAAEDLVLPDMISDIRAASGNEEAQLAALNRLADQLQRRFDRRPGDLQNGYMLGTLYLEIERVDEAATVFRRMLDDMEPGPDRATVLGQLAQAEYMRNGSEINDDVRAVMDEALALNPNEYSVLSILAIDAFLRQDFVGAIGYWRRQLAASDPGSQQAATLRQRIAAVEAYLPADQQQIVQEAATAASVTLTIDIDPQFAAQLDQYQSLFVYIRNPAMPMPIVAQNLGVPDFPLTITLDDSSSMTGMTLGSAPQLMAGARLSRTGVANRQSGDLQVESMPFTLSEQEAPLSLVIDQVVP